MKKIFLFAAAAMVSLSSCVQTEDVYTGGLNEIGFKSAAVRGAIEGTSFGGNMAVAAAWDKNAKEYVDYFKTLATDQTGAKFTGAEAAGSIWKGEPARYWPNAGKMQFIALYPYECGKMNYAIATTGITGYTVADIVNETNQHDVLFSDLCQVNSVPAATQALTFHHALAQLKVTFKTNHQNVVIKSVTVKDVAFDGDLAVTAAATSEASWTVDATKLGTFSGLADEAVSDTAIESTLLIIPAAEQTELTIVYTFDGHEMTKVVPLKAYGDWKMGNKYIYNFTISANEITFTVSVDKWTDVIVVDGGITI